MILKTSTSTSQPTYIYMDSNLNINGMYIDLSGHIYINLQESMNECWRRFTIIKELCSAYVGHYQSDIIDNTIYECETEYVSGIEEAFERKVNYVNSDGLEDGDIDSETFAILIATELLIPRPYREITRSLLKKVDNEELTLNDVAKSLLIPESVLKLFKNKNLI